MQVVCASLAYGNTDNNQHWFNLETHMQWHCDGIFAVKVRKCMIPYDHYQLTTLMHDTSEPPKSKHAVIT